MAHYSVELVKKSGRFTSAWLEVSNIEGNTCYRLTKEKLYIFLERRIPSFSRYATALRNYSFSELCQYLHDQYQYGYLFNVEVNITRK